MGTRLGIWPQYRENEEVGNDHKLYFYQPWENVSLSFRFLFDKVLRKVSWFEDCGSPREAYKIACCFPGIGPYTISEEDFRQFAKLYLQDFMKTFPDRAEDYARIAKYMFDMSDMNGNKVIEWW